MVCCCGTVLFHLTEGENFLGSCDLQVIADTHHNRICQRPRIKCDLLVAADCGVDIEWKGKNRVSKRGHTASLQSGLIVDCSLRCQFVTAGEPNFLDTHLEPDGSRVGPAIGRQYKHNKVRADFHQ